MAEEKGNGERKKEEEKVRGKSEGKAEEDEVEIRGRSNIA